MFKDSVRADVKIKENYIFPVETGAYFVLEFVKCDDTVSDPRSAVSAAPFWL